MSKKSDDEIVERAVLKEFYEIDKKGGTVKDIKGLDVLASRIKGTIKLQIDKYDIFAKICGMVYGTSLIDVKHKKGESQPYFSISDFGKYYHKRSLGLNI